MHTRRMIVDLEIITGESRNKFKQDVACTAKIAKSVSMV